MTALAIAVSVTGILGKILSELYDGPARQQDTLAAARTGFKCCFMGSSRGRPRHPVVRLDALRGAVRNASVIGAVCGGGLGGGLLEELNYDNKQRPSRCCSPRSP